MKVSNRSQYSATELAEMEQAARTSWTTAKLARRFSKKFKRSAAGVYNKIKQIRDGEVKPATISVVQPKQAVLDMPTAITDMKISKVEIFEDHMKLYF
jgi:hypothetical protein